MFASLFSAKPLFLEIMNEETVQRVSSSDDDILTANLTTKCLFFSDGSEEDFPPRLRVYPPDDASQIKV